MGSKSKSGSESSKSLIDFGKVRKKRISLFRAKKLQEDVTLNNVEEAVNRLVDQALDAEGIPTTI